MAEKEYYLTKPEVLKKMVFVLGYSQKLCKKCGLDTICYHATNDNKFYLLCRDCFKEDFGLDPRDVEKI